MSPKPSKSVLAKLQSGEAVAVLRQLLAAHPELEDEAERIARSLLQAVDFRSVADAVEDEIRFLDYDDLNARAGHHEWGYVEPGDAAMEILEEAVQPFIEDMTRHLDLGFEAEALEVCKGVILGLYRLDKGER